MDCIEVMMEEHKNIKRMLEVIRKYCYKILKGENVQYEDFYKIIDFIRNYADRNHHGKEEKMLFNRMVLELGPTAEKLVKYGMNVEHDMGRLFTQDLEIAVNKVIAGDDEARLDVIANAVSYTHLLHRHINKEDGVVYKYAQNNLNADSMTAVNEECERFEKDEENIQSKARYLKLIDEMEEKLRQ